MMSNNAFVARTCIVGVVVTSESNMAPYFPEAGNLNGINADMCSDVAGPSSSGSGDCLSFQICLDPIFLLFTPLLAPLGHHLGFERDYNSHIAFRDVLRHCVRSIEVKRCGLSASVYGTMEKEQLPPFALMRGFRNKNTSERFQDFRQSYMLSPDRIRID